MGNQYTKKENLGLGSRAVVVTFKATHKQAAKLKRDAKRARLEKGPYIRRRLELEGGPVARTDGTVARMEPGGPVAAPALESDKAS